MKIASNGSRQLRIGWIGFHAEGVPALTGLLDSGVRIECAVTLTDEKLRLRSGAADYSETLAQRDVPLIRVSDINSQESLALLRQFNLDVVFVIGWSQILKPETLATARIGMIGAHASLLPRNRGSAPINWALIRGETCTGNTLIWLSPGVDEGEIIDQMAIPISPYDTVETLYEKVGFTNRAMILRVLPALMRGERPGVAQPHDDEPLLPRRRPSDGKIDWALSSAAVYDFVRALTRPYPGAFGMLAGERWTIWNCALLPAGCATDALPGTVIGPVYSPEERACGQAVACGTGAIVILEAEDAQGDTLCGRVLSDLLWAGSRWSDE